MLKILWFDLLCDEFFTSFRFCIGISIWCVNIVLFLLNYACVEFVHFYALQFRQPVENCHVF